MREWHSQEFNRPSWQSNSVWARLEQQCLCTNLSAVVCNHRFLLIVRVHGLSRLLKIATRPASERE